MSLGKVVITVAKKGGAGKTYLTTELFTHATINGLNVLLIEFEPQTDQYVKLGLETKDVVEYNSVKRMVESTFNPNKYKFEVKNLKDTKLVKQIKQYCIKHKIQCGVRCGFIGGNDELFEFVEQQLKSMGEYPFYTMLSMKIDELRSKYDLIIIDTPVEDKHNYLCKIAMHLAKPDDALLVVTDDILAARDNAMLIEALSMPDALQGMGKKPKLIQVLNKWEKDSVPTLRALNSNNSKDGDKISAKMFSKDVVNAIDFYGKEYFGDSWCRHAMAGANQRRTRIQIYDGFRKDDNLSANACAEILEKLHDPKFTSALENLDSYKIKRFLDSLKTLKEANDKQTNILEDNNIQ